MAETFGVFLWIAAAGWVMHLVFCGVLGVRCWLDRLIDDIEGMMNP